MSSFQDLDKTRLQITLRQKRRRAPTSRRRITRKIDPVLSRLRETPQGYCKRV